MIVNGASRRSVGFWTKHLQNDVKNERAELKDIRGLAAHDLHGGLLEMEVDAQHTRCTNFFYHAVFNPTPEERLTDEQWERTFEIFEKHRGIPEGQSRIVYEHEKHGRVHRHVIWSRVDLEHMRAWSDSLDAKVCHAASREISEELGLHRSISPFDKDREGPRPERAPKSYEMFRGQKTGHDPRDIKAEVTGIFRQSEHAADFIGGLREHGYELVSGDRRDYCLLDPSGNVHSVAKRLDGVNTKQLREFMKGVERDDLPTIEEAKARQYMRNQDGLEADLNSVQKEIAWEEALARAAIAKERVEERFVEPTSRELRERDSREKAWPSRGPTSEKTATSPELHIGDAIRQTTRPKRTPTMLENLKGVSATIWEAYNIRTWVTKGGKDIPKGKEIPQTERDPFEFQRKLSENNITLAVATKDEADRSHRNSEFAKAVGHYSPRFKEGEFVAITEHGNVYKLSQRITGDDERTVARFLKPLGRSQFKGIDETKAMLSEGMEKHVAEVQNFRDTLRDVRSEERHDRATKINKAKGRTVGAREKAGTKIERIGSTGGMAAIGGLLKGAEKIADGLLNMFDPVLTPAQKLEAKIHEKEREAEADQQIDISKYTAERAAQQMQDRERIERGRDRDR